MIKFVKDNQKNFKELSDLEFLELYNDTLLVLEKKLEKKKAQENFPNIFLLGAPRSGLTLLSMMIKNSLKIGCINNYIARYWRTPLVGVKMWHILMKYFNVSENMYKFNYGQTANIKDCHEFSYFWHHNLCMETLPFYNKKEANEKINWEYLKDILNSIANEMNKPMVYKAYDLGYHLEKVSLLFDKAIFVYLKRDFLDNSISIMEARLNINRNLNQWWSNFPLEYSQLKDQPYWKQITGQVYFLNKMYEEGLSKVDPSRVLYFSYEEICKNPNRAIEEIAQKINYSISKKDRLGSFDNYKKNNIDKEYIDKLLLGIRYFENLDSKRAC